MKKTALLTLLVLGAQTLYAQTAFNEITEDSGLKDSKGTLFAWGDINNDGNVDLLAEKELYLNLGAESNFKFKKVNDELGLSELNDFGILADVNGDARLDITTRKGQIWIQKENGTFENKGVNLEKLLYGTTTAIALFDYDGDGDLDLFATKFEKKVDGEYTFIPPQMIRNDGDFNFTDISSDMGLDQFPNYGRGIAVLDFDHNGTQDFYLSNYRLRPNDLFVNKPGQYVYQNTAKERDVEGEFDPKRYYDEVAKESFGPYHGHTIGSTWGDFDNDGNFDLWVSNLVHKYVGEVGENPYGMKYDIRGYVCDDSKIYKNLGAPDYKFKDMRDESNIPRRPIGPRGVYRGDELWSHAITGDFDNDGLLDVYVPQIYNINYSFSLLYKNVGNFKFGDVGGEAGIRVFDTYGGAWADFNNDGRLDLITAGRKTNDSEVAVHLFRNDYKTPHHFLKIKLKGDGLNQTALGTIVTLTTESGKTFSRALQGGTGAYNQQNDSTLHFGLGEETQIKSIRIAWPSGDKEILDGLVKVDRTLVISK